MTNLKNSKEKSPVKLANIFFNKEFIDNFNFKELLQSYVFEEELLVDKFPTEGQIAETIGRFVDKKIKEYANIKSAWTFVEGFMKFFPSQVAGRKNNHINFFSEEYISIYNNHNEFGITIGNHPKKDKKLTYKELQDKFKRPIRDHLNFHFSRSNAYFSNTYLF